MDNEKLKNAFTRIKNDMEYINGEILLLKKSNSLNEEIKTEIRELKKYNLEKFINNLENEFKSTNSLIREFNQKSKHNSIEMKKLAENLKRYHFEITEIKKKLSKETNITANTELDVKILDEKLNELHEIITEKMSLENAQNRLELQSELARMANEINNVKKFSKKETQISNVTENINEIAEMLNEKMTLEINALRLEFTEEMAKLYDKLYSKTPTIKETKNKTTKKPKMPKSLY